MIAFQDGGRVIKAWVGMKIIDEIGDGIAPPLAAPDIEETALKQLKNLARLPFIARNGVAAMADVHAGKGATIGSVVATKGAVIPSAVGVDIGCGVNAVRTDLTLQDFPHGDGLWRDLAKIRPLIEKAIPTGNGQHQIPQDIGALSGRLWHVLGEMVSSRDSIKDAHKAALQLGSLGGGNHFIEICVEQNAHSGGLALREEAWPVWIMLHSGSRGIGNVIGRHYIDLAKRDMEKYFITLPDADLAYLPEGSEHFDKYMAAVSWAQDYAMENRRHMMRAVHRVLCSFFQREVKFTNEAVNCHHNYIARENHYGENLWVTRKGAIRARSGDLGIIPGSMGQRSYIVRGKGNPESYCSCSHGAGRTMSRTEARRRFTAEDLARQTEGVECRKDDAVVDEIPSAYKSIDEVMANQTDLVEVVHTIKQVLCVKGA
jgi:tRNA-splicing ligase RtcB